VAGSAALLAASGVSIGLGGARVAGAQPRSPAVLKISLIWSASFLNDHHAFGLSSPVVAALPRGAAAVAGDRSGHIYAIYLKPGATGGPVTAWTVTTKGPDGPIGVDSSPSSEGGDVYVGVGYAGQRGGGYEAINPNGSQKWFRDAANPATDPTRDAGVAAGLTVASLQSQTAVVGPSLGQNTYVWNAASGKRLSGFPWYQADTNFSTAAVADVEGNGRNQIVEGGNTTAGTSYGTTYADGGQIRILGETGNAATPKQPNSGTSCVYKIDQGVDSSPALGDIFSGRPGIVVGTSTERPDKTSTDDLFGLNGACHKMWQAKLVGATTSSPALADVLDNGLLQVVEGTESGYVYCLSASSGAVHWRTKVPGEVVGGVVTVDLGSGAQDVIVPSTLGAFILNGKTGALVQALETTIGLQNSPLVTDDPNGTIGITIAGAAYGPHAVMEHFEIVGSDGSEVTAAGTWPEFHHDPQLSGNANVATADNLAITTRSLPAGSVGTTYAVKLKASGGTGPYVWSRPGGSKPPGLGFSTNGSWSGIPTKVGTYTVLIRVTDATGTRVTVKLSIVIAT
jgi:hypothetical protein